MRTLGALAILLSFIGGIIYLQIRLSQSANKYVGIVLPAISFLLSLFIILGNVAFLMLGSTSGEDVVVTKVPVGDYIGAFFIFLIANIPTAILLAIYFGERARLDTKSAIDKMKIEDL